MSFSQIGSTRHLSDLLVQHSLDAIFLTAPDGRILAANPAACALFGYTEVEFVAGGRALISDSADPEIAALLAARKKHGSVRGEQWMRRKDGSWLRVEVTSAVFEMDGEQRTALIVRDLSHREHHQYLERVTQAAAHSLPLAFCIADEGWRLLWVNPATERITGYPRRELLGKPTPLYRFLAEHDPDKLAAIEKSVKEQGKWSGNVFARRRSGEIYPLHGTITTVESAQPGQRHLVATLADVSAMRDYERRLREASLYDPVTGLPNRVLFERQVTHLLEQAPPRDTAFFVMLIDIDSFRAVNESLGYDSGDHVLAEIAQRLRATLPAHGILGRHMGDSFTLFIPGTRDLNDVAPLALRIGRAVRDPLQVDGSRLALSASIGISSYPDNGCILGPLLQTAESALRWIKERGGNDYACYESGAEEVSRRFVELTAPMCEGLANGEFLAYFQPIVDGNSGCVVGMEALARWKRADGTFVSPASFIPVAERSGMIGEISEVLLHQACRHLRQLEESGHADLITAVTSPPASSVIHSSRNGCSTSLTAKAWRRSALCSRSPRAC